MPKNGFDMRVNADTGNQTLKRPRHYTLSLVVSRLVHGRWVSNNSGTASLTLSAAAPVVQGNASCSYQWQRYSPAFVHSGPRIPSERENQCVFVRGFSIKLRRGVRFAGLGGKIQINVADLSGGKSQNFSGKGDVGRTSSGGGNLSGNVTSGRSSQNRESPADPAEQTPEQDDHMVIETFPEVSKV
jgi:hypothetical protein